MRKLKFAFIKFDNFFDNPRTKRFLFLFGVSFFFSILFFISIGGFAKVDLVVDPINNVDKPRNEIYKNEGKGSKVSVEDLEKRVNEVNDILDLVSDSFLKLPIKSLYFQFSIENQTFVSTLNNKKLDTSLNIDIDGKYEGGIKTGEIRKVGKIKYEDLKKSVFTRSIDIDEKFFSNLFYFKGYYSVKLRPTILTFFLVWISISIIWYAAIISWVKFILFGFQFKK